MMTEAERREVEAGIIRDIDPIAQYVKMDVFGGGYTYVSIFNFAIFMSTMEMHCINNVELELELE